MCEIASVTFDNVSSLFNLSMRKVACEFPLLENEAEKLPPNVKGKLLSILSKRGMLTDLNISKCLNPKLKELDLSECDITDKGLQIIGQKCKILTKLDLNSAKMSRDSVTDAGIGEIAKGCQWIQVLYLRRCLKVGDDAILQVSAHCRSLKFLNLGGCSRITDQSLKALADNCAMLECLNVSSTKVTDCGVFDICRGKCSKILNEFHMAQCVNITDESVEAITEFCPKIRILIFHGCPKITESSRMALEQLLERNSAVKQLTWTVY